MVTDLSPRENREMFSTDRISDETRHRVARACEVNKEGPRETLVRAYVEALAPIFGLAQWIDLDRVDYGDVSKPGDRCCGGDYLALVDAVSESATPKGWEMGNSPVQMVVEVEYETRSLPNHHHIDQDASGFFNPYHINMVIGAYDAPKSDGRCSAELREDWGIPTYTIENLPALPSFADFEEVVTEVGSIPADYKPVSKEVQPV